MAITIFCIGVKFDNEADFNERNLEKIRSVFGQITGSGNPNPQIVTVNALPLANVEKGHGRDEKPASVKQKDWVQSIARKQPMAESDFYRQYDAKTVNDLSCSDCDAIIKKYSPQK